MAMEKLICTPSLVGHCLTMEGYDLTPSTARSPHSNSWSSLAETWLRLLEWPGGWRSGRGLVRRERYVDVQTVQDHVDACFQASLAGIDLAKCRKPGVPLARESWRNRERWKKGERVVKDRGRVETNGGGGGFARWGCL